MNESIESRVERVLDELGHEILDTERDIERSKNLVHVAGLSHRLLALKSARQLVKKELQEEM